MSHYTVSKDRIHYHARDGAEGPRFNSLVGQLCWGPDLFKAVYDEPQIEIVWVTAVVEN